NSYTAVAGKSAGTSEDEITEASQAGHCLLASAARDYQARDLGQATGDEGGDRVVAQTQSVTNSGGDGDDVFQSAAQLDADDVVVGVNPKTGIAEFALHS